MKIFRIEEITTFPEIRERELTPEELKEAYALARASFTAADLQEYTELDEGVPADEVMRELDETEQKLDQASS